MVYIWTPKSEILHLPHQKVERYSCMPGAQNHRRTLKPASATGPTIVQTAYIRYNAAFGPKTISWNQPTVAGNLLLMIYCNDNNEITPPTDWTRDFFGVNDPYNVCCFSILNAGSRSGAESIGSLFATRHLALLEVSGMKTSSAFDDKAGASQVAGNTVISTGTFSPAQASELLIACLYGNAGTGATDPMTGLTAGYTLIGDQLSTGNPAVEALVAYRVIAATGSYSVSATLSQASLSPGSRGQLAGYKAA